MSVLRIESSELLGSGAQGGELPKVRVASGGPWSGVSEVGTAKLVFGNLFASFLQEGAQIRSEGKRKKVDKGCRIFHLVCS